MEEHNSTADRYDDNERKKLQITTTNMERSSSTHLEDLSNEVIYEIFDFLDMYHMYEAFFNLNIRFQNLLACSTIPIKINLSFLSKSNFQRYYTQFILPNIDRISSIHLWNPFIVDLVFSSPENIQQFIQLKTLILDNIKSDDLLEHLTSLPNLSSLIINQVDGKSNGCIGCYSIFRLPALKYCKVSCEEYIINLQGIAFNKSSPIVHLVINSKYDLNTLGILLSCVPHLHRLSIDYLCDLDSSRIIAFPKVLDKLTHVFLKLKYITFDRFQLFIRNVFHHLQVLRISTSDDIAYLDANRWERLILLYMVHLRIFDIQHSYCVEDDSNQLLYDALIKQFTSSFWTERQWFFAVQYWKVDRLNYEMFYSTQPYRRRCYTLYGKHDPHWHSCHPESNLHLVRHIHIQNQSAMEDCLIYFPNANELTISVKNVVSRDSITIILNRILPLGQLNQITIDCDYFGFATVFEMLRFIPNCYKLILNSILLDERDLVSLQRNATFQLTSNTSKITDVTIKSLCTLEKVKLLVKCCPRLQHLTIEVLQKEFTSTLQFLLSKSNNDTRHLLSLCTQSTSDIWMENLMNVLRPLKRSDEFHVRIVGYYHCYLWL